jgi:myo-inositol-1(or 4)-monophosphatase
MTWDFLATATEAALQAGALQKERYGQPHQVEKKGEINIVTEVDKACEALILALLRERFPEHDIVAEESLLARTGSRYVWFVDPLDGTTNFAHGYPFFCVSIALARDQEVIAGVVYDPVKEELFTAERGSGAHMNGRRLRVTQTEALIDALLVTGFPYDLRRDVFEALRVFYRFMSEARGIRRDGAAALDLAYVAAGRMDAFFEERLHPWDILAGGLMVEEAGGRVSRFDGSPLLLSAESIVACGPHLHEPMLAGLRDLREHPEKGLPAAR